MEIRQESSLVHFLRAVVLIAALVAVPGTAVCWNLIPKDVFQDVFRKEKSWDDSNSPDHLGSSAIETSGENGPTDPLDHKISNTPSPLEHAEQASASPSELFSHDLLLSERSSSDVLPSLKQLPDHDNGGIKTMSHAGDDQTTVQTIPADFSLAETGTVDPAVWNQSNNLQLVETNASVSYPGEQAIQSPSPNGDGFPALEKELKSLGAKYYRLEKWGSRGDLFRFSCYVTPAASYQYQKYFQAIDSDELRVMRRVVEDIKLWKERL